MRAGSTAKATATSAGRGHIRGTGRPGVNSSHPAVLKSPSICMSTTRPHSIAGTDPSPFLAWPPSYYRRPLCQSWAGELVRWLDKCRICGQPRKASTPALPHSQDDVHHFPGVFSVSFIGRPTYPLSPAATWLLTTTLPLLLDVASRPPAGPAKSRAGQGCPSPR